MSVGQMPHLNPAPVIKLIISSGSWSSEHIILPLNVASITPGYIFLPRIDTFYQVMKKTPSLVTILRGKYFEIVRTGQLAPTSTLGWLELSRNGPLWRRGPLDAREPDPPRVPGPYGLREIHVVIRPIPEIPDCTRTTPPVLEDLFVVSEAMPPQSLYGMVYNGSPDIHDNLTPTVSTYLSRSPGTSSSSIVGRGRRRGPEMSRAQPQAAQAVAGPSRPTPSSSSRRRQASANGKKSKVVKSTTQQPLPVTPLSKTTRADSSPCYWYPQVEPSNPSLQQTSNTFPGEAFPNFGAITPPGIFGPQPTTGPVGPWRGYDAASSSGWQNPAPLEATSAPYPHIQRYQESQPWLPASIPGRDTVRDLLESLSPALGSSGHTPAPSVPQSSTSDELVQFSTYFDVDPRQEFDAPVSLDW
ncbi:uncharacterized protein EI90DRAFT_3115184 [Cantharellus anzutake]|uniref:uncharacterized protein n=1 Tax=Cantharellus anzutake TaxID=1750568 RepID=UPI0019051397|nr:uncharacterized protein EI90DRAFT_3115184 [Cantharellus anzutake]KAF8342604.1 hypothetical protein EI90DRAFT_3115184 [Cantharellus anzutake]